MKKLAVAIFGLLFYLVLITIVYGVPILLILLLVKWVFGL